MRIIINVSIIIMGFIFLSLRMIIPSNAALRLQSILQLTLPFNVNKIQEKDYGANHNRKLTAPSRPVLTIARTVEHLAFIGTSL